MTTFSESFDKADSPTLGPDLTWTKFSNTDGTATGPGPGDGEVFSNSFGINGGNRAGLSPGADVRAFARAEHNTGSSTMYAQARIVAMVTAGADVYPAFQVGVGLNTSGALTPSTTDTQNGPSGLWVGIEPDGFGGTEDAPGGCGIFVYLYDQPSHTQFTLDSTITRPGGTPDYVRGPIVAVGDIVRLEHDAATRAVTVKINGFACFTATYAAIDNPTTLGQRGGLAVFAWNSPNPYPGDLDRLDNFQTGTFVPAATPEAPINALRATHYTFANFPATATAVLDEAIEQRFLASPSDAGFGHAALQLDDPEALAIAPGDLIAFDVIDDVGTPTRAFVMLCNDGEYVTIDPGEEAGQTLTWEGPGHLAVFKRGVLGPPGGVRRDPWTDDVIFDYVHVEYDDSGPDWIPATVIETVERAKGYFDETTFPVVAVPGWEPTWPVPWSQDMPQHAVLGKGSGTTMILGPSSATIPPTFGIIPSAPVGSYFLREKFTTAFDGVHQVYFTCDNTGEFWIDGKQIMAAGTSGKPQESGFTRTSTQAVSLSAGEHTIAIKVTNWPNFGLGNPTGVAAAIYIEGFPPDLIWETTSAMKINEYPVETPGMTVGTVIRLALKEHQDAGRTWATNITLNFSDTLDSAGATWPAFAQIASRVGVDCYAFLRELMATYVDLEMDPNGWTLNAWIWGTRNPASGVTFEVGNLTALRFHRQDTVAQELLMRWAGGHSSSGSGEVQAFEELGPQITEEEIGRIGGQLISVFGNPREQRTLAYDPRVNTVFPWVNTNYVPGSTVTTPTRTGGTATDRALEIGCSYTKDGERVLVTLSVKDIVLQAQERIMAAIKR